MAHSFASPSGACIHNRGRSGDMLNPRQVITALKQNIGKVIVGKDEVIELLLIAMLCKGHVLIEDVPGTGKTTLAGALAKSLDCSFNRIQFTPDVVPSDVTGFTMVNFKTGELEYRPGLVMSQIVLADEISPDTCRFWDIKTHEKLDKDRFRRDLGGVEDAYKEMMKRVGLD